MKVKQKFDVSISVVVNRNNFFFCFKIYLFNFYIIKGKNIIVFVMKFYNKEW